MLTPKIWIDVNQNASNISHVSTVTRVVTSAAVSLLQIYR